MDAVAGLQRWLEPLLEKLEPQQKQKLMRELSQGLRLRFKDRITQQRDPDQVRFIPRKRDQVGKYKKQGGMFQKIHRLLKSEYTSDKAEIGFDGRTAEVAQVHQDGLTIRPYQKAHPTRYAVRKLVGFGKDDEDWAMKVVESYFAKI